jgi:hypothetical protein
MHVPIREEARVLEQHGSAHYAITLRRLQTLGDLLKLGISDTMDGKKYTKV